MYWLLKNNEVCSTAGAPPLNLRYNYIFNHKGAAFIRINYSPQLFKRLLEEDLSQLDGATQLSLTQDTSAFEDSGVLRLFVKVS